MSEKCSKCGKENITFNKDWVCVDCMSEQLLGGLDEENDTSRRMKKQGIRPDDERLGEGRVSRHQPGCKIDPFHVGDCHTLLPGDVPKPRPDMVNNPPHYNQFPVEVIDIIEWYFPNNYHLGNATKYLLRSAYKGHEIEDLRKLVWYVERYIASKEGHANTLPEFLGKQGDS